MEAAEARTVLGVGAAADAEAVRAAYRRLIRAAHPDVAGTARTLDAARLNEAYAVLVRTRRSAAAVPTHPPGAPAPERPAPPAPPVTIPHDGPLLRLPWPPPEAFARTVEAGHLLGEVTHIDRSCSLLEVIVDVDGEACSFLCAFVRTRTGTDVRTSLESIERVATLPAAGVTAQLARLLRDGA